MHKVCSLCQINQANKKNTHYLTDSIIRTALNLDGSNVREKGFNFTFDSQNPNVELKFQKIDEVTLLKETGRLPTEDEIEEAKKIPFSVDYVFCKSCEDRFTEIENSFNRKILSKLRGQDLSGLSVVEFEDVKICRDFFYIQVFRSAVAGMLDLPPNVVGKLRDSLFNDADDRNFSLKVMHLETLGDQAEYTRHIVGFTSDKNPFVIYMNDFIIQICEEGIEPAFLHIYGISKESDYYVNFNLNEKKFIIEIVKNEERNKYIKRVVDEQMNRMIKMYESWIGAVWRKVFQSNIPREELSEFFIELSYKNGFLAHKFSKYEMSKLIAEFIYRKKNN